MAPETQDPALGVYAPPARWIHWIVAVLVLVVIPAGLVMVRLPSGAAQNQLFDLHRSIGILILALAIARVLVRVLTRPPGRPESMPAGMWAMADGVHSALYALIFVMPLLGWLASSAYGAPVYFFGLVELPALVGKNEALSETFGDVHGWLGYLMTVLVLMHIGAALFHGIIKRDGVLSRMLPGLSR